MQSPLSENLDAEILRLEAVIAAAGLVLSAAGLVLSSVVVATVSRPLGLSIAALSAALVVWFGAVLTLARRGIGSKVFQAVCPLVEISVPTALLLIDATQRSAEYAVAVSVPLQLYGAFVALQVVRLRRLMPLFAAMFGAAQYLAAYMLFLRPRLHPTLLSIPEFDVPLACLKAAVVILSGVAATAVGLALRGAVGRAASRTRASELFGKYRLQSTLAEGGMGTVHRALYCPEGGFARPVALKRIHPHLAKNKDFVDAFRREAELSSRLVHANIVQVIDFGRVDDTYFLSMEYVDGMTLGELLRRASAAGAHVPERILVRIGMGILDGLHFAGAEARDAEGRLLAVVHRDLNPPNVLLSHAGEVRISDFGIARAIGEGGELLTATLAGKTAYMSPEQARGDGIDVRSDLFAAAVILWEMATLRRLFARGNDGANLVAVLEEPAPPPSTIRTGAPHFDAFFATALAKRPDDRFQSAREMKAALEALLPGRPATQDELRDYLSALAPLLAH
jgi:serine/threonine-protein kinase